MINFPDIFSCFNLWIHMIIFSQCDRFVVLLNLNSCLFVRGCICVYLCMQPVAACCSMLLCVSAWASALQSWSVFKRAAAVSSASTFTTNHTSITQHTATLQHTCCKVAVCCSVSPLSAACRPSSHILHWLGYMIYEYRYKTSTSTYHHTQSIEIDVHHMSMGEVGGWGRDPKKCTGRDWGMGSSTI